jgi:DNA-binding beta-propeller fold protein YncE
MHRLLTPSSLLLLALTLAAGGCASSGLRDGGSYGDDDGFAGDDDDGDSADPGDDDAGGAGDDDDEPPPEEEDDFLASEPRATDVFVFIANPERDTVSKVNAETRAIETIEVGDEPTMVVVSADYERAVAFNASSDSVTVIDADTNATAELDVREDFNFIQISPDGRWVVAWFNAALVDANFDIDGVRSFTEVSFVDTVSLQVQSYSVGFNPKDVRFTADSNTAIVLSDAFITVAHLDQEPIALDLLDLGADPLDPPVAAEVEVTPSGAFGFIRYQGSDGILVVDLADGSLGTLDGGLDPSDLDLSPNGLDCLVVSRGSSELRVFDATDPLNVAPLILPTPPTSTLGSLVMSPDGSRGLLFTTAVPEDRITFWDVTTGVMVERRLEKPVDSVAISPDGASALIIHTLGDAPDEDDLFTNNYALTVVDLNTWLTNPVVLASKPLRWTTSNDGRYSLFVMENNRNVGVIDYRTRLVDDVLVPSIPVYIGIMPLETEPEDAVGWVSQQHELGRLSFVKPFDLSVQTVTGFELNSEID